MRSTPLLGRTPTYALVKGRANYACLNRIRGGVPDEQGTLVEIAPSSVLGKEVLRIRRWVEKSPTGDRDELVPGVSDRAWAQTSVSARECLGADRCPEGAECFAERARWAARKADVVVTNHALLAIDALHNRTVLPDHDVLVVDEAHELVSRVTGAASAELTAPMVERAAPVRPDAGRRRARRPARRGRRRSRAGAGAGHRRPPGRAADRAGRRRSPPYGTPRAPSSARSTRLVCRGDRRRHDRDADRRGRRRRDRAAGAAYLRRVQALVGRSSTPRSGS